MVESRWQWFLRLNDWLEARPRLGLSFLALLIVLQINPWWYPTPDACSYYSIARNLAREHTLENLGEAQLWFAPGYPLLISPLFLLEEHPFVLLAGMQALLGIAFLLGVYHWARRTCPQAAFLIAALAVVNVLVWHLLRRTLSEIAFMAVLLWAVNALHGLLESKSGRRLILLLPLAILLVCLAALIRPAGVLLAGGLGMVLLRQAWSGVSSWRRAAGLTLAVGVPASLLVIGLMLRDSQAAVTGEARTYLDNFAAREAHWTMRYVEGLRLCLSEIGRAALPGMHKSYAPDEVWLNLNTLFYMGFGLALAAGWVLWIRQRSDVLAWTFPFYLLLHVLYAMDSGARFFVPMLPLVVACCWVLFARLGVWRRPLFNVFFALHLVAAGIQWLAVDVPRARKIHSDWPALQELAGAVGNEHRVLATADVPGSAVLQFQLLIDRRVAVLESDLTIHAEWLIMPLSSAPPARYSVHTCAGRYQLLKPMRDHSAQATRGADLVQPARPSQ